MKKLLVIFYCLMSFIFNNHVRGEIDDPAKVLNLFLCLYLNNELVGINGEYLVKNLEQGKDKFLNQSVANSSCAASWSRNDSHSLLAIDDLKRSLALGFKKWQKSDYIFLQSIFHGARFRHWTSEHEIFKAFNDRVNFYSRSQKLAELAKQPNQSTLLLWEKINQHFKLGRYLSVPIKEDQIWIYWIFFSRKDAFMAPMKIRSLQFISQWYASNGHLLISEELLKTFHNYSFAKEYFFAQEADCVDRLKRILDYI